MNCWITKAVLLLLAFFLINCAIRNTKYTIECSKGCKALLSIACFIIMLIIGWYPIQNQWNKDHQQRPIPKKEEPQKLTAKEIAAEVVKQIPPQKETKLKQYSIKQTPASVPPTVVMQLPSVGNLRQRSIDLSQKIMEELYRNGWEQRPGKKIIYWPENFSKIPHMPTTQKDNEQWVENRSAFFKFRFLERVIEIRNEFSQLHIRDENLDDFLKYQGMIEDANKRLSVTGSPHRINTPILPQQIEEVSERLRILAEQLK